MPFVDFHTHTTVSDGVWQPHELFDYVRQHGIEAFSLTDHDTMDGYPLPPDIAARAVPGMEVDTKCNGVTAHLLVYGIHAMDAPLLEYLRAQRAARRERMADMLEKLADKGIRVDMSDVEAQAGNAVSLGRPHLARALVALGIVGDIQEAFDRYLADDQEAYVSLDRLDSPRAIELAHESGAIVSVAHPCRLREPASLDALRLAGIDAVEVLHPSADEAARGELRDYARRYDLLVTGGSDFHAPEKGYAPGVQLEAEHVERLFAAVEAARTPAA